MLAPPSAGLSISTERRRQAHGLERELSVGGGYKTGDGIDPALLSQFPIAEAAARALGLVTWSMIDFECDDALATMAVAAAKDPRVERVLICSPDKDLTQCARSCALVQTTHDFGDGCSARDQRRRPAVTTSERVEVLDAGARGLTANEMPGKTALTE